MLLDHFFNYAILKKKKVRRSAFYNIAHPSVVGHDQRHY